jgi:hypothetical protein
LLIGVANDLGDVGTYYLDDLLVTATSVPSAVESRGWGPLKAAWR